MMHFLLLPLILPTLLILSISSFFTFSGIEGEIQGDRYISPNNVFSVEIPNKSFFNRKIYDHIDEDSRSVAFTNDLETKIIVKLYDAPEEFVEHINNKERFKEVMEGIFSEGNKNAKEILHKKYFFHEDFGHSFFGIADIPHASEMVCLETNERCDTIRGSLFTLGREHMIIITAQLSPVEKIIKEFSNDSSKQDHVETLLNQVISVRRTLRCESKMENLK